MSKSKRAPGRKKPVRRMKRPIPTEPLPFVKRRPIVKLVKLDDKQSLRKARASAGVGAGAIVNQIIHEIEQTVANAGKTLSANAFQEFRPKLVTGITNKLLNNGDWSLDGPNVLAAARKMGVIACINADPASEVTKAHLHPAFYSVKNGSTVCAATSGAGSWCDFFI